MSSCPVHRPRRRFGRVRWHLLRRRGATRRPRPARQPFSCFSVPTLRRLAPEANIPARPVAFAITTTLHPAHIPPEVAGSSRRYPSIPARWRTKDPLSPGIPAYPRSRRKRHDRPVTPEVAGRVPSLPSLVDKSLQIGMLCCPPRLERPPASCSSRAYLHGNPRPTPPDADNPRNLEAGPIAGGRSPGGQSRSQPVAFTTSVGPTSRRSRPRTRAGRLLHAPRACAWNGRVVPARSCAADRSDVAHRKSRA